MSKNIDLARECGAIAIPAAIQTGPEDVQPMVILFNDAQLDAFAERIRVEGCDAAPESGETAWPKTEFEKVAPGLEVGYDMFGGVDIRLGGEFVYVHINYDYRYTHNAARKSLADNIVRLLTEGWPKEAVLAQASSTPKPSIHAGFETVEGDFRPRVGPGQKPLTEEEITRLWGDLQARKIKEARAAHAGHLDHICGACEIGAFFIDSNGYNNFPRCNLCGHVPFLLNGVDMSAEVMRKNEKHGITGESK